MKQIKFHEIGEDIEIGGILDASALPFPLDTIIIPHYRKTYNRQNAQNSRTKFG